MPAALALFATKIRQRQRLGKAHVALGAQRMHRSAKAAAKDTSARRRPVLPAPNHFRSPQKNLVSLMANSAMSTQLTRRKAPVHVIRGAHLIQGHLVLVVVATQRSMCAQRHHRHHRTAIGRRANQRQTSLSVSGGVTRWMDVMPSTSIFLTDAAWRHALRMLQADLQQVVGAADLHARLVA